MQQNMYEKEYSEQQQKVIENEELLLGLSYFLMDLMDEGDKDDNIVDDLEEFNSPKLPQITLVDYVHRISKQAQCSQECFIMAIIYIDRLSQKYGRIILKPLNIHRLYVIAVMISAKFYDDRFFQNVYYAKVAGISHAEFNNLEQKFLILLDFQLLINPEIFFIYRKRLVENYIDDDNNNL